MKSIITFLGTPRYLARTHLVLTWVFVVLVPVSIITGWIYSIVFLSALSLWALVAGHWSAWQASRVEVVQDEDADVQAVLDAVLEGNRLVRRLIDAIQGDCEDPDEDGFHRG